MDGAPVVSSSEAQSEHELHYAPLPPPHRRRAFTRVVVIAAILAALLAAWGHIPQFRERVRLFRLQRSCLHYKPPDGTIALRLSPATSKSQFRVSVAQSTTAQPWVTLYATLSPPGLKSDGTAFVHERTSPAGHRRLVCVDLSGDSLGYKGRGLSLPFVSTELVFTTKVFEVGTFTVPKEFPIGRFLYCTTPPDVPVTVAYGKADDKDDSHFTIELDADDVTRIIDGWLLDDDRLVLEFRDGDHATPPAPPSTASSR
jgi:hypothetical protein